MQIEEIGKFSYFDLKKVSENDYIVQTDVRFIDGTLIDIHFVKNGTKWYLTDKKSTLKYMNNLYELNAKDVKSCIAGVLKIYGFAIKSGALFAEVPSELQFKEKFFEFIMCISQLANMYAFFDDPVNH